MPIGQTPPFSNPVSLSETFFMRKVNWLFLDASIVIIYENLLRDQQDDSCKTFY